jgi:hypothetical protein
MSRDTQLYKHVRSVLYYNLGVFIAGKLSILDFILYLLDLNTNTYRAVPRNFILRVSRGLRKGRTGSLTEHTLAWDPESSFPLLYHHIPLVKFPLVVSRSLIEKKPLALFIPIFHHTINYYAFKISNTYQRQYIISCRNNVNSPIRTSAIGLLQHSQLLYLPN